MRSGGVVVVYVWGEVGEYTSLRPPPLHPPPGQFRTPKILSSGTPVRLATFINYA